MVDAKRNNSHPGPLAPGAAASRPLRPASVPASRCQGGGASSPWLLRPLHRGRDRCHRQDRGEGRSLVRVRWPRCVVTDRPPFYRGRSRRPAAALIYQLIVAEARPTEAALKWAFPARRTTAALASASSPGTSGWSSHGRQGPTLAASALRSANGRGGGGFLPAGQVSWSRSARGPRSARLRRPVPSSPMRVARGWRPRTPRRLSPVALRIGITVAHRLGSLRPFPSDQGSAAAAARVSPGCART